MTIAVQYDSNWMEVRIQARRNGRGKIADWNIIMTQFFHVYKSKDPLISLKYQMTFYDFKIRGYILSVALGASKAQVF